MSGTADRETVREPIRLPTERVSRLALEVVNTLKEAGHEAYVVGGGVRDLLLGSDPKDFDVATSARPSQVKHLFERCRLVGRRFPIAHVLFGHQFIEVTTFRALDSSDRLMDQSGRILRDSSYGSLREDAFRRDFTVNALYYDPEEEVVIDFTGGLKDLRSHVLRLIGDPETRYREDPVRMLRAIRFETKLGLTLAPETEAPLRRLSVRLADIPAARLFDEVLKLFLEGYGLAMLEALRRHKLFGILFPLTEEVLVAEEEMPLSDFVHAALANSDARVRNNQSVTPAFLFAALLWPPIRRYGDWLRQDGVGESTALQRATSIILSESAKRVTLPRRFSIPLREILRLQSWFRYRRGKRALSLLHHARFRAAYDFYKLRAEVGDAEPQLAQFWTEIQAVSESDQLRQLKVSPGSAKRRSYRRRKRPTENQR